MFQGFSQETVDFMWGIRFNNERGWFMEHKGDYQRYFHEPMKALGAEVQEKLLERFPECGLNVKLSRIYRDARRLFGRGPYKDHLWFSLYRGDSKEDGTHPVLWFELGPEGWSYGMGFWCAKPVIMLKHRTRIDRDHRPMLDMANRLAQQEEFLLEGEEYSKMSRSAPCEELVTWYKKRSLALIHEEALTEELYSRELVDHLVEGFSFLMPYFEYFSTLWADPDPREL